MDPSENKEFREKAGLQSADDPFQFVLSDETPDRVGDIIRVKGWQLDAFKRNPIALYGHDHQQIIGSWENIQVKGGQLVASLKLAAEGTSEFIDVTRRLVEQRILKAVSVGLKILKAEPVDRNKPYAGLDIKQAELTEASLCAVGQNPNALAIAKALSPELADKFFIRLDARGTVSDKSGQLADPVNTPQLDRAKRRLAALDGN